MRKLFIAGSTGAVGRTLVRLATARGIDFIPHRRPHAGSAPEDPRSAVFDLSDAAALVHALPGCTTVVQLIGTMRKRFEQGDTYETSDIGTTRQLVEGARRAGSVDHIVLLSSVGAGRPVGAYLKAKADAETIVTRSGIEHTIFRPGPFVGEGHKVIPGTDSLTRLLGLSRYRPIQVEQLAAAILACASGRAPLGVLEGDSLWSTVKAATARP